MWSLSNAFTSAFKKLDPVPQFKATAKLGEFSEPVAGVTCAISPSRCRWADIARSFIQSRPFHTNCKH
jgi:hypothetical protein